jgi:hypothetical protein
MRVWPLPSEPMTIPFPEPLALAFPDCAAVSRPSTCSFCQLFHSRLIESCCRLVSPTRTTPAGATATFAASQVLIAWELRLAEISETTSWQLWRSSYTS